MAPAIFLLIIILNFISVNRKRRASRGGRPSKFAESLQSPAGAGAAEDRALSVRLKAGLTQSPFFLIGGGLGGGGKDNGGYHYVFPAAAVPGGNIEILGLTHGGSRFPRRLLQAGSELDAAVRHHIQDLGIDLDGGDGRRSGYGKKLVPAAGAEGEFPRPGKWEPEPSQECIPPEAEVLCCLAGV